ncbi:Glutamate 5-kinase [Fundidesulfovibrio magnetotacticus]|uniref:Glutamate 5-kinase n=1 Tax=Fundidesulfovibrio magnetotacticus TaxID=2730080 RepID=A0A6V8LYW1_9BACT|nr:glutamate 5-kinase [Fundidesulfovibrio magnetotacticus]GFK95189.1 Glutamate 5-kinase [Fundidesulfovibrio magnetotacticus]
MEDWKTQKAECLAKARRIVVKAGSAVLTSGNGVDLAVVKSLAKDIAALHRTGREVLLVSSGAVAAGRAVIRQQELAGLPDRQAASAIGQSRLMHAYDEAFGEMGIVTAQLLLTRDDLEGRERYLNVRNTLRTLLSWRSLPVVNENDTVAVQELVYGDNDCLASLLVGVVGADLFVNLTSAKGVFTENPAENPKAAHRPCIEDIACLDLEAMCRGKTASGTGGMHSKLLSARRAAQLGVPTLIVAGREPDRLSRAFAGEDLGTWVAAEGRPISRRKYWLAYTADPRGGLWVDQGAAQALRQSGKSLLPAGIVRVEGDFEKGAVVRILDFQGQTVGVGLANYDAGDLKKIMGLKSGHIAQVLGQAPYPEAVHRDNMVLDAAL